MKYNESYLGFGVLACGTGSQLASAPPSCALNGLRENTSAARRRLRAHTALAAGALGGVVNTARTVSPPGTRWMDCKKKYHSLLCEECFFLRLPVFR